MAIGNFGQIRPADVEAKDIEILYNYVESRNLPLSNQWTKLDSTQVLLRTQEPNSTNANELLGGLYTIKLPVNNFNTKGFYYIMIRPKQIRTTIKDVGVLYSNTGIRGIVLDPANGFSEDLPLVNINNNLIGYRIEYINQETKAKVPNQFTIVTSSNKAEVILSGGENSSDISSSYNLNASGNLVFLTLTPSSESSTNTNYQPFIGSINQNIIITNTFFNPEIIELEVVEHDMDTLAWEIGGNRIMDVAGSKYTVYNDNDEIYKQVKISKKQNAQTGDIDYEISQKLDSIDETQDFDTINSLT